MYSFTRLLIMQLSPAFFILAVCLFSCSQTPANSVQQTVAEPAPVAQVALKSTDANGQPITTINTGKTKPGELIGFARTLTGITYKYGSTDPQQGFDCSGFITYVFNHFKIAVPRSSVDFTHVNHEISLNQAKPGDLILFTGTDSTKKVVGHMGILVATTGPEFSFIHATSGKAYGVTETPLNSYYQGRFMKTIRVFPQNDQ